MWKRKKLCSNGVPWRSRMRNRTSPALRSSIVSTRAPNETRAALTTERSSASRGVEPHEAVVEHVDRIGRPGHARKPNGRPRRAYVRGPQSAVLFLLGVPLTPAGSLVTQSQR